MMYHDTGSVLVFDYTPNLTIAGTMHALNHADKKTLDGLIQERDFVALEWDAIRQQQSGVIKLRRARKNKYDPKTNTYYARPHDFLYLSAFGEMIRLTLAASNMALSILEGGLWKTKTVRNTRENEFKYCISSAQRHRKDVYLVDMPIPLLFDKMVEEPWTTKIRNVVCIRGYSPTVLLEGREEYMMQEIEKAEGCPINQLTRRGLLVVGCGHAYNYHDEAHHQRRRLPPP
jgi:hypothetical protein